MAVERMAGAPSSPDGESSRETRTICVFSRRKCGSRFPKTGKIMANQQVGWMICRGSWVFFFLHDCVGDM